MEPQIYTDEHRFFKKIREDFFVNYIAFESFDLSVFICVHLCKSVVTNSYIRAFSCLFVAKKLY